jgi:hypothetical protein
VTVVIIVCNLQGRFVCGPDARVVDVGTWRGSELRVVEDELDRLGKSPRLGLEGRRFSLLSL